ncbi:ThiF family adenylyltransferase [Sphingobium sp. JS3065]|uniref:HesA/MoeB/ThiF family protein n=1 Tax=Sphingobium sp. JS3065 TaxID=2970925 RepID=UPI0022650A03|nr:ThiF family adenylyltransferase [Sphingobium sp. JS3065]UZW57652.1 ThiF family adenylyltransferase [Sphingobium sp. JS3065]
MSRVRFPAPLYSHLASRLLDANGLESCAIAYAHHDGHSDTWIVADASPVPEDAYERRDRLSAVLKPSFLVEVANRSRVTGMAVIAIHTHPASPGYTCFSSTDNAGETELSTYFARRAAKVPHVALVIGPEGCRARLLGQEEEVEVWEVGQSLTLHSPLADLANHERDDRQVRAFGAPGQRLVRRLRFAVIGAGGTGSIECQQLAHLGAALITVIDPDLVEETNLNRLVGSVPSDVGRPKVEIAARMIRAINPDAMVIPLQADIVDEDLAKLIATFDFVLLCTDSHASRAVVNQAAYQYLVPVIDMGVSITVADGAVTHITGRVQMLAPELPCLTCSNALDSEAIRREMLTPEQRAADPYVQGVREPQPAVLSINSTVSSLAMTMMLGAVTPVPVKPRYQIYDGIRGRVKQMVVAVQPHCVVCSSMGAFAKGPTWDLPVRPTSHEGKDK